jgi:antitoxin component YwqK of YwqJK toxin-antitoxin module
MIKFSRNRNIGIIVLLLLFGCGKKEKEVVLIERDGVTYEQGAQKPYSGKMSSKYNNGNMKTEGEYKDGLPVGTWKFWDRDGTEYTGAVSKYVFHEIQSGETLKSIANNFEVDVDQLYELNEDIDNDTGDKIKAGQVIGVKTADDADGQFLFWYDKQRIKIKSHKVFINGKRNGKWTFWNENGNIVRTGSYAAGKRDGSYAYYFNDGSKKEEGAWKNDQRDGLWVKYSNNGNTQKEGTYSNGKKDGVWTTWNDKGLMASKYLYENNKVIDKWAFKYQFYSNGNEKTLKSTRNNKLDGKQTIWHQNGQMKSIGNYTTGKENGDFQEWYENGQLSSKNIYVDGVIAGEFSAWYENGQMQSKVNYLNGNMDGAYSEWFDNGQMRQQGSYVDNEFYLTTRWNNEGGILIKDGNGKWVGKNAEGRKLWAKEYQDGRLISDWEYKYEYFDNGQIKKESSFQGGQEDGESTIFFENGKTREEGTWKEGEYLITNRWNKNGNQIITDGQGSIVGKNKKGLVVWQKEYIGGRLEFDQQNTHEYYDNGQLKSEIGYSENKKHGRYSMWYENGQIKAKGTNSHDAPYGYYVEWLEDGKMREEGTWTEDGENLIQNRWNKNGNQIITNGQGNIIGKNKEGLVVWQKEYIGGRLEFDQKNEHEYYDNGQVKSETGYFEGKKHGLYKNWFENGQLKKQGKYQNDISYGRFAEWFENGQLKEQGEYRDGQYFMTNRWSSNGGQLVKDGNGSWVGRNTAGLEVWKKLYADGLLSKEWNYEYEYYGNGELMSSKRYNNGVNNGQFTTWYEGGQKRSEGHWEDGKKVGKWFSWHSNGQVEFEGFYIDDQKDGLWVSYDETGTKVSEDVYAAGELINNSSLE